MTIEATAIAEKFVMTTPGRTLFLTVVILLGALLVFPVVLRDRTTALGKLHSVARLTVTDTGTSQLSSPLAIVENSVTLIRLNVNMTVRGFVSRVNRVGRRAVSGLNITTTTVSTTRLNELTLVSMPGPNILVACSLTLKTSVIMNAPRTLPARPPTLTSSSMIMLIVNRAFVAACS